MSDENASRVISTGQPTSMGEELAIPSSIMGAFLESSPPLRFRTLPTLEPRSSVMLPANLREREMDPPRVTRIPNLGPLVTLRPRAPRTLAMNPPPGVLQTQGDRISHPQVLSSMPSSDASTIVTTPTAATASATHVQDVTSIPGLNLNFPLTDSSVVPIPNTLFPAPPPPPMPGSPKEEKYFEILHQPNEKQRKSYARENRYLLPNPIIVCLSKKMKSQEARITQGTVYVRLVYETGEELEESKRNILQGVKTKALDKEKKAKFCLKVTETSDKHKYRLLFTVKFILDKTQYQENILSHCFKVTSNKKVTAIERPKPYAIKPNEGSTSEETEVWIRGKYFTDRGSMIVTFGDKEARIIETEENLLVCYPPPRSDITTDTTVNVRVTTFHPDLGQLTSDKTLEYTYYADKPKKRKTDEISSMHPLDEVLTSAPTTTTTGTTSSSTPAALVPVVPQEQESVVAHFGQEQVEQPVFPGQDEGTYSSQKLEELMKSELEISRICQFFTTESS